MTVSSFSRAPLRILPSLLRPRLARTAVRPPIRAVSDLGAPWTAPAEPPPVAKAPAPAPRPAPAHQESILELLRRLERGLAERAELHVAPEPAAAARPELDSALRTALETLQKMARQER